MDEIKHIYDNGIDTYYFNGILVPQEIAEWLTKHHHEFCANCDRVKKDPEAAIRICGWMNKCDLDTEKYIDTRRKRLDGVI